MSPPHLEKFGHPRVEAICALLLSWGPTSTTPGGVMQSDHWCSPAKFHTKQSVSSVIVRVLQRNKTKRPIRERQRERQRLIISISSRCYGGKIPTKLGNLMV